jgi:N-acetylneuraminic acid mutarotase
MTSLIINCHFHYSCLFLCIAVTNVWKQLETSGDGPKALNLTAVVIDSAIYTFGGIVDGEGTSDLHVFDTASKRWSLLSASGRAPEPRGDHCATTAGRKMYIFGGSGGEDVFFNDLYVLDISSLMWTEIYPNGRSPAVREFATLCGYGEEMLILFGGTAATTYSEIDYNDIHAFDLQSNEWQGPAVTGPIPEKRYSHCSVTWRDQMIVFGGLNSNQDFNDLCILHLPQLELSSDETASAAVL